MKSRNFCEIKVLQATTNDDLAAVFYILLVEIQAKYVSHHTFHDFSNNFPTESIDFISTLLYFVCFRGFLSLLVSPFCFRSFLFFLFLPFDVCCYVPFLSLQNVRELWEIIYLTLEPLAL